MQTQIPNFLCIHCLTKTLPFCNVTINQLMYLFQNTIKEIIKLFANVNFERISDNIENCNYFELENTKTLFSGRNESGHFFNTCEY